MVDPITFIMRQLALLKHSSKVRTGMLPLSRIKNATVLLDPGRDDVESTRKVVERYFQEKGIKSSIICPGPKDVGFAGYYKRKIRGSHKKPRVEDVYISLIPDEEDYAVWFDAVCSPARFKLGCCNYKKDVFNIIINIPEGKRYTQIELFATMANCMERVE